MSFKKRKGRLTNSTITLFLLVQKILYHFSLEKSQIQQFSFEVLGSNVSEQTLEFSVEVMLPGQVKVKMQTLVLVKFEKAWKYYGQRENFPLELEFQHQGKEIAFVRLTITEDVVVYNYNSYGEEVFVKNFLKQL